MSIDVATRKKQLVDRNQNLNILREQEAKFAGNAPLGLLNQIEDHRRAIDLIEQALAGCLSEAELEEELKPLLLACEGPFANKQVWNEVAEAKLKQYVEKPQACR